MRDPAWTQEWRGRNMEPGDKFAMSEVVYRTREIELEGIVDEFGRFLAGLGWDMDGKVLALLDVAELMDEGEDGGEGGEA